jgi:signal transduction histidine kinase
MRKRKEVAIDLGLALATFAATLALLAHGSGRDLDALGVVLAAGATWPLVLRRRSPLAVLAATTAASAALNGLDYALGPPFGPTVALFFVAADERTRARIQSTAAVVVVLLVLHLGATGVGEGGFPLTPLLFAILVWGSAWVAGDQLRQRRQRLQRLEERAQRERRLAVAEERMRIARDLHDSAGHAINVILVQAGAARLLHNKDPERTETALETIEEVARGTLGEIDQLVQALREDSPDQETDGMVEPPPGLGALDTLAERHRANGLDVNVSVGGARRQLPARLDRAAYRILQEALTNAARHGHGHVDVDISFGQRALELVVSNPVNADSGQPGGGHGLIGMRERVALLDGTLETGATNGVFRIRAQLPYDDEESE